MATHPNYASRHSDDAGSRRSLPASIRAALSCIAAAVGLVVVSVVVLGERLVWEGGDQIYLMHFPFQAIWCLCGLGTVFATASLLRRQQMRVAAVVALGLNLLVGGWFVRSYLRTLGGVRERHPNWTAWSTAKTPNVQSFT